MEVLGVGVGERDDFAVWWRQAPLHIASPLPCAGPYSGRSSLSCATSEPGRRAIAGGVVVRGGVDDEHLVQQARILEAGGCSAIGPIVCATSRAGSSSATVCCLAAHRPLEGKLVRTVGAPGAPVGAGRGLGRGRAGRARPCGQTFVPARPAAVDGDALAQEGLGERLVLEGRAYRQSAAAPIGRSCQCERCAGEVRMLDGGVAGGLLDGVG